MAPRIDLGVEEGISIAGLPVAAVSGSISHVHSTLPN